MRGFAEGLSCQIFEEIQPTAPECRVGKVVKKLDDGQGEPPEVSQSVELLLDVLASVFFFRSQLGDLLAKLALESGQTGLPSVSATDDRCIDQQPLPLKRGAQAPCDHRTRFRINIGVDVCPRLGHRQRGLREELPLTGHEGWLGPGWRAVLVRCGRLSQRQVFGKARRRQALRAACKQGQEGSSRRIRSHAAARVVTGNAAPSEGVFDQRLVSLRVAEQHGHLVKPELLILARRQNVTGDFDAFPSLVGRREEHHAVVGALRLRDLGGENRRPKSGERCRDFVLIQVLGGDVEGGFQPPDAFRALRKRDRTYRRRFRRQSFQQRDLRCSPRKDIQEDDRQRGQPVRRLENRFGGRAEHGGSVGHLRPHKLLFIDAQQVLEVRPGRPDLSEGVFFDAIEAEFGDGSSQRSGETDGCGYRREIGEAIRRPRQMDGPCCEGFDCQPSSGREGTRRETLDADLEGQLSERHPVKTHPASVPEAVVSDEIVRGPLCRSHDQDFRIVGPLFELPRSETNSCFSGGGCRQAMHWISFDGA